MVQLKEVFSASLASFDDRAISKLMALFAANEVHEQDSLSFRLPSPLALYLLLSQFGIQRSNLHRLYIWVIFESFFLLPQLGGWVLHLFASLVHIYCITAARSIRSCLNSLTRTLSWGISSVHPIDRFVLPSSSRE